MWRHKVLNPFSVIAPKLQTLRKQENMVAERGDDLGMLPSLETSCNMGNGTSVYTGQGIRWMVSVSAL